LRYFKNSFELALKDINQAIRLNKEDPIYYIARAKIYYYNDNEYDDELAVEDLYTAIKMGSEEAKKLLEEYFEEDEGE
jgi:hypothetical protein